VLASNALIWPYLARSGCSRRFLLRFLQFP
jgi:hypothetical protein